MGMSHDRLFRMDAKRRILAVTSGRGPPRVAEAQTERV